MARNKILIERGRLVVTDRDGNAILAAQTSKKYAGRIDVHLEGFIAHMDYDQAKAEFKKEGVPAEAFEQAFSKLKKNRTSRVKPNITQKELTDWKRKEVGALGIPDYLYGRHGQGLDAARKSRQLAAQNWRNALSNIMEDLGVDELDEVPGYYDHINGHYWLINEEPTKRVSKYYKKGILYFSKGKAVAFRKGSNFSNFHKYWK